MSPTALIALVSPAAFAAEAPAPEVEMTLLPAATSAVPGEPLEIGVRLAAPAGWHLYWENPGDAGMPPELSLEGPEGWSAGPARFPAPARFVSPGDIESFGYEGEVVLFLPVTAPPSAQGQAALAVTGRWLVCREVCVMGSGGAALTLPVATPSAPANQAALDPWRARLPEPWTPGVHGRLDWDTREGLLHLVIAPTGGRPLDFFPAAGQSAEFAATPSADPSLLTVSVSPFGALDAVSGVVPVEIDGEIRFYSVTSRTPDNGGR